MKNTFGLMLFAITLPAHAAGFGPRIDYRLSSGTTVYVQYLRKENASRLTLALVGTF